jgi:GWxTD domain-containing protein
MVLIFCLLCILCAPTVRSAERPYDEDALLARLQPKEHRCIQGMQYLMNPFQQKQFLELDTSAEREAWIEKFWSMLDPTPTTPRNERRIEHEARVSTARELFGAPGEPGWDLRGEIYIRFGPPDSRDIIPVEFSYYSAPSPPQEAWYYIAIDMLVVFADITQNGKYTGSTGRLFSKSVVWNFLSGGAVPLQDFSSVPGQGKNRAIMTKPFEYYPLLAPTLDLPNDALTEKIAFYHAEDIRRDRLTASVDIASFLGGQGKLRTEVSFDVPASDVGFFTDVGGTRSCIELRTMVRDMGMDSVAFGRTIIASSPEELKRNLNCNLLPGILRITLDPGYYHIGMEVIDHCTGRSASFRRNVWLEKLDSRFCLSDVQFAGSIRETGENSIFVKGNLEVVPHASRAYRSPDPVAFYFEIYGLSTGSDDIAFYAVEYGIEPLDPRRWGPVLLDAPGEIASRFETSGYGSTQHMHFTIATDELWAGRFRLIVRVTDRRTLVTEEKTAVFRIL